MKKVIALVVAFISIIETGKNMGIEYTVHWIEEPI